MIDCYHNYLWLGFATGSVGGPTPYQCPGQFPFQETLNFYDLSGVEYVNRRDSSHPRTLNFYTDDILDSMKSLSRFTSLVRWQMVGSDYRPMRAVA